ncbi:MAG TPA: hypothetical protein VF392_01525 [Terracidiphilus sp.]
MAESTRSAVSTPALTDNVAGMLAYLTFIPAVVFLVLEPYRGNRAIRFHAWQCIFLTLTWCAAEMLMGIVALTTPALALPLGTVDSLFTLATLIVWIMLMIKTINNERFKLPLIGNLAETIAKR